MNEFLARVWDAFKAPPRRATLIAFTLIALIIGAEILLSVSGGGTRYVIVRAIQIALLIRLAFAGSRTTKVIEAAEIKTNSVSMSALDFVTDTEVEIFNYVKNDAKEKYAGELNAKVFQAMSLPPADIVLSRLETVFFEPQDVILEDRNWLTGKFATKEDYAEFAGRDNGQKFYIYHLDTGVDQKHKDLKKAVVKQTSFTKQRTGDRNGHGTFSASMYASTNPLHSAFPEKVERGEIVVHDMNVLTDDGRGDFSQIVKAIVAATKDAPKQQKLGYKTFLNMSLGADAATPSELSKALLAAKNAGIILFAATGNSALDKIGTPANDPSVVSVTAITPQLTRANFANIGEGLMFAEGGVMVYGAVLGNKSGFNNGTSFSCPWSINKFIAAGSLYQFADNNEYVEYVQSVSEDIGEIGYDTIFGFGCGTLRKILDNAPETENEIVFDDPIEAPLKKARTFVIISGYEITWCLRAPNPSIPYHTIFVEELHAVYDGFESTAEAEKIVTTALEDVFSKFKFKVSRGMDYTKVAKLVFVFLENYFANTGLDIKFNYALIDDNNDNNVSVELDAEDLGQAKESCLFNPTTWSVSEKKKHPATLSLLDA